MLYQVPLSVFQMKRAIRIIIQWCVVVGISLQITVTSSPFPIAGDTLSPDMILLGFFSSAGLYPLEGGYGKTKFITSL